MRESNRSVQTSVTKKFQLVVCSLCLLWCSAGRVQSLDAQESSHGPGDRVRRVLEKEWFELNAIWSEIPVGQWGIQNVSSIPNSTEAIGSPAPLSVPLMPSVELIKDFLALDPQQVDQYAALDHKMKKVLWWHALGGKRPPANDTTLDVCQSAAKIATDGLLAIMTDRQRDKSRAIVFRTLLVRDTITGLLDPATEFGRALGVREGQFKRIQSTSEAIKQKADWNSLVYDWENDDLLAAKERSVFVEVISTLDKEQVDILLKHYDLIANHAPIPLTPAHQFLKMFNLSSNR